MAYLLRRVQVSFIIPSYNQRGFIKDVFDSAKAQSLALNYGNWLHASMLYPLQP